MSLRWKRTGSLFGIPARDLTDAETEKYGGEEYLIGTGLYEKLSALETPQADPAEEKTTEKTTEQPTEQPNTQTKTPRKKRAKAGNT